MPESLSVLFREHRRIEGPALFFFEEGSLAISLRVLEEIFLAPTVC